MPSSRIGGRRAKAKACPAIIPLQTGHTIGINPGKENVMIPENIISRVGRLIAGIAHAAIDKAEGSNRLAVVQQAIREIEDAEATAQADLAQARASGISPQRAPQRGRARELTALADKIRTAIAEKRDDLARSGIARQIDLEAQQEVLAKALDENNEAIAANLTALQAVRSALEDAEARLVRAPEERGGGARRRARWTAAVARPAAPTRRSVRAGPSPVRPACRGHCFGRRHRRAQRALPRQADCRPPGQAQVAGLTREERPMSRFSSISCAAEVRPFAIAAMMILVIGLAEAVTMLIGFSLSEVVGKAVDFDGHSENGFVNAISWLNVGGVPLLIFMLLFLGVFSITGFVIQDLARPSAGRCRRWWQRRSRFAVSVPLVRQRAGSSRGSSRATRAMRSRSAISSAASARSWSARSTSGLPGRVRVKDVHGNLHFVGRFGRPASRARCRRAAWYCWSTATARISWRSRRLTDIARPTVVASNN